MSSICNRRILLGITGGIAAYKAAELARRLKDHGADVRVVMTAAAQEFITPLTLQALTGNPVHTQLLDPAAEAAMGHIELAKWADAIIIAPASADFIARYASGMADDLLTTLLLASPAIVAMAPAMNQAMWQDRQTQNNILHLSGKGIHVFGPAEGEQACGDVGPGRMLEPTQLADMTMALFPNRALSGKTVVITAGPTQEAIDPVRYISNHSSGKMGFALAQAAIDAGARVILITGPVNLPTPDRVERIDVISALDMLDAARHHSQKADIFIGSAAVADYRPDHSADHKIKKSDAKFQLQLIPNPDIISNIAALDNRPFMVGFAAETENLIEYAQGKLEKKKLDMIVANDVSDKTIGFNSDDNAVTIITHHKTTPLDVKSKANIARDIVKIISATIEES